MVSGEAKLINEIKIQDFCNIKRLYVKPFQFCKLKDDFTMFRNSYEDKKLMNLIDNELSNFNFNKTSIGYTYLVKCIMEVLEEQDKLNNIERDLFPCVAKSLKIKNPQTIKWNIRKLIDSMVRYTDREVILKYFNTYSKNPTPKLFLKIVNENIINKYENIDI